MREESRSLVRRAEVRFRKPANILLLIGVLFSLTPSSVIAQHEIWTQVVPAGLWKAAEVGLPHFLKAIPSADYRHYDLSPEDTLEQAGLGNPFRIHTIYPDRILNYNPSETISEIIASTSMWYFPVILGDRARMLLTVDFMENEWKAVAIGAVGLAREWVSIQESLPASAGYRHIFVRVYQAQADFVLVSYPSEISEGGRLELIPTRSAIAALNLKTEKSYKPSDLILKLRASVTRNLKMYRRQ